MDETILLGHWNVDECFGTGAMEDVIVFFGGDGRGCYARENLAGVRGCVFQWWLSESGLNTADIREFSSPLGNFEPLTLDDGERWQLTGQAISVGQEETLAGATVVLRLVPSVGDEDAFARMESDSVPDWPARAVDTFFNLSR